MTVKAHALTFSRSDHDGTYKVDCSCGYSDRLPSETKIGGKREEPRKPVAKGVTRFRRLVGAPR